MSAQTQANLEETLGQSVVNPQLSFDPFPSGIYQINSRKHIRLQFMSVVIHQLTIFYAPLVLPWQERNREQTRNPPKPEEEIASLQRRIAVLKAASSPRTLKGGANLEVGVILPSRSTHQRVKPDTEKSETVPHTTSNFTGQNNSMTGVTRRGVEPSGSTPPRHGTSHGRISLPRQLATTQVDPNTVESEIGPRTKRGSASAVSATNDDSINNVISCTIGQHSEVMSKATLNPNDSPSLGPTGSRRPRKKKEKSPTMSILAPPSRINVEGALPSPNVSHASRFTVKIAFSTSSAFTDRERVGGRFQQ